MCRSDPQIALAVTLMMASVGSRVEGGRSVAVVLSHAVGYPCRGTPGSTRYAGGRAGKAATVTVIVGTSGWQYRDWRGRFYPPRLPKRLWLEHYLSLIHISEPTRLLSISYAVFCLKKKKKK